jgi:hypothetical protein
MDVTLQHQQRAFTLRGRTARIFLDFLQQQRQHRYRGEVAFTPPMESPMSPSDPRNPVPVPEPQTEPQNDFGVGRLRQRYPNHEKADQRQVEHLHFGQALATLRDGERVARRGWNGRGQYLELQVPDLHSKTTLPYILIRTVQGDLVPWVASQSDLLAWDWCIVTERKVLQYGTDTLSKG